MPHGLAVATVAALVALALAGWLGAPPRWWTTPGRRLRMTAAILLLMLALVLMAATMAAYW